MSDDGSIAVEAADVDMDDIDAIEAAELSDLGEFGVLAEDLVSGDVLDGIYKLGIMLGEGAMGRIFEAQDLDLNRQVAIKVPLIEEAVDILIAEARAMAALRHEHLPVVHAAGRHHGVNFLVMEKLNGVDLDRYVEDVYEEGYALSVEETLDIVIKVTDALTAIHHAGVAHRDIKPENVLLCKRGPVLIDFGLVAPASADEAIQGGSPCYVAPEIITNTAVRSSRHLSDVYSLGILMYEMLTGEVPFDHDDIGPLLKMHLLAPIPDVRALRPNVPPKLAILVREMMAKKPGERPSAEEALWAMKSMAKAESHRKKTAEPTIMVASNDLALVGRISKMVKDMLDDVKVRVCRKSETVMSVLEEGEPDLMMLDMNLEDMSGMELMMQFGDSETAQPAAMVALTPNGKKDPVLERFGVMAALPRGDELREALYPLARNCFMPRPRKSWFAARVSRA